MRISDWSSDVCSSDLFDDSKTFVDCAPRRDPEQILAAYRERNKHDGFELADFVTENFNAPVAPASGYESDPDQSLCEHIDSLWDVLTRSPKEHQIGRASCRERVWPYG